MGNKLSNSAVDRYIECSLCYKLHFMDRIRPIREKSALTFGKALDNGLNELLLTRDLEKGREKFKHSWSNIQVNKKTADHNMIDYSKSDLDQELLDYYENNFGHEPADKSWASLYFKGLLFIDQYFKDVLPKIKKVVAVQEPISLKNDDGDEITGILDLIVEWNNGKTYLLDNKSSSVEYAWDSAKTGQQLPLYYYIVKEKYKLDGVGYIVLNKKINKNRIKKCKQCGMINQGTHKTCANIIDLQNNTRCKGEFDISINPTVDIQYIFNEIDEKDEQRVMDKFDEVNYNVANGYFATEHTQTKNKFYQYCPYKEYTPENTNFIQLPKLKAAKKTKR